MSQPTQTDDCRTAAHESAADKPPREVTVYIVDDHPQVVAALVRLLEAAPGVKVVGWSTSAPTARHEIEELRPDVAVIDGHIGGYDGLDLCRELADRAPEIACVMITAGTAASWGQAEAIEAGAAAVLVKQLRDFPLVEVVTTAARRRRAGGANR